MQVRPRFDQDGRYVCMLVLGSEVQRGQTFPVDGIHLMAVILEVSGHVTGPALNDGVEQWRPSYTGKLAGFRPVLAYDCHLDAPLYLTR